MWWAAWTSIQHLERAPERPRTSFSVPIYCPDDAKYPPTFSEVPLRVNSWPDNWFDGGSFQGEATYQFGGAGGEVTDSRLGEERIKPHMIA